MKTSIRQSGFTLRELVFVLGLTLLLAVPLLRNSTTPPRHPQWPCRRNLQHINLAFQMWADDHQSRLPMSVPVVEGGTRELVGTGGAAPHFGVLSNYVNRDASVFLCPKDAGRVAWKRHGGQLADTNLSYFINVDASLDRPGSLLAGERALSSDGVRNLTGLVAITNETPLFWLGTCIHNRGGFAALAGGPALRLGTNDLKQALAQSGGTNRLVFP